MGLLDANIPQMLTSQSGVVSAVTAMRSTMASAEQSALASQAFHMGEASAAFQAAHARFVEVAAKVNGLLDIAQMNLGEAATTYVAADAEAASTYTSGTAV